MIDLFFQGGPFMWPILLLFILGIALSVERFRTLMDASIDTRTFLQEVKVALNQKGYEGAMEVSSNTKGPVASIFYADRKSVV